MNKLNKELKTRALLSMFLLAKKETEKLLLAFIIGSIIIISNKTEKLSILDIIQKKQLYLLLKRIFIRIFLFKLFFIINFQYNPEEKTNEPGILGISYKYDGIMKPIGGFLVNKFL